MTKEWRNLRPEEHIRLGDEWWDERDETWNEIAEVSLEGTTAFAFGGEVRRRVKDVATEKMQLLADIRELQTRMTPAERGDFWSEITAGYCSNCGQTSPCSNECWIYD